MDIFPLDIASGNAFCNRTDEIARLIKNIVSCSHTLITAPRRMGKTSLVMETLSRVKLPKLIPIHLDLLLTSSPASVQQLILKAVGEAINEIAPITRKISQAGEHLRKAMLSLRPQIEITESGFSIKLEPTKSPVESISDALVGLDKLAQKYKYRVLFYMDEFQQIAALEDNTALEAAIRHAAQHAKATSYIFTGSNRHLLSMMFEDSARPLYHICDRIVVERISREDYIPYIQKQARKKWKKTLSQDCIEAVLEITQRHPYYVNVLCRHLWRETKLPIKTCVEQAWEEYVLYERARVAKDLGRLSNHQRELLRKIALEPTSKPYSEDYLSEVSFSRGSVRNLLARLVEQDYVARDHEGFYHVQDPVTSTHIRQKEEGSTIMLTK